ncbi:MAG: phosphatidate cytidylyltransferase [bacterium]|nr:phosphatidate cytidylyltransferase [bacterium]
MDRDKPHDPEGSEEWEAGGAQQDVGYIEGAAGAEEWAPESDTETGEGAAWDNFSEGSPVWSDAEHHNDDLDVGYLTEQHPQATEIGVTDTAAGAQFFGDGDDEVWHGPDEPQMMGVRERTSDRRLGPAIATGALLCAVAVVCFWLSSVLTLVLLCVLTVLAAGEFFSAMRVVGYQPATLVGLVAAVGLPVAVYWRGAEAYPLGIGLVIMAALCWHLVGVTSERPVPNVAVTLFGVGYVVVLGSFGALMLTYDKGTGLLFGAVVGTVAYDVGAWAVGRMFGRTRLSAASPNKTVEGLIGGAVLAVVASAVVLGVGRIDPWGDNPGSVSHALVLGIVVAVAATLGDLSESMIKRDLGIKDMGNLLPGHGGVLDRFDGLLFAMPVTWGLALLIDVI